MGIEEQIDRLIDLGEDIKSKLDLLFELASDHFAGANKMVVEEPAKEALLDGLPDIRTFAEPNLRWRILEPGEEVQEGDLMNCKLNPPSYPPNGDGWIDASICVGSEVAASDECVFARPVADEPAKQPEPEYREPVLPADVGQPCEFSMTGKDWYPSLLSGFQVHNNPWISSSLGRWNFARIKKES